MNVIICNACGRECEAWTPARQGTTFPLILSRCCNAGTHNILVSELNEDELRKAAIALRRAFP